MSSTSVPADGRDFAALGVAPDLVRALARRGITTPFPIQTASLPDSLAGRDVLGKGRTGSGKTVAFALPIVQRLVEQGRRRWPGRPHALVLVPTRELAIQVAETLESLATVVGLRTMTIVGGVRYAGQVGRLERGVDIVIATPGRLEDLLTQEILTLRDVASVVVDEADLMADMGFLPPVTRILEQVPPGQRMLFSATLDGDVQVLVDRFLRDPLVHSVDGEKANVGVRHHLFGITFENKREVLHDLLVDAGRTLLFVRTKTYAEKLAADLTAAGIPAGALHGNLRQGARQRNLSAFADGTVGVLVATDIAARGIHVDDIGLVVHVDPPTDPKAFLHRSGRTARAGAEGAVVTLATRNQNKTVKALMAQAGIKPVQTVVAPGAEIIEQVKAPRVAARPTRPSIFEPDPEDVLLDEDAEPRGRGRDGGAARGPQRSGAEPWARGKQALGGRKAGSRQTEGRPSAKRRSDDPWGRKAAAEASGRGGRGGTQGAPRQARWASTGSAGGGRGSAGGGRGSAGGGSGSTGGRPGKPGKARTLKHKRRKG